jgi:hypothetical protein
LKKSILALCALTLAAGLSACGGGTSSYTIGGTVFGLEYPGLVLQNNLANDLVVPVPPRNGTTVPNVTYSFSNEVDYGDPYSVTVKTNPEHQKCEPSGGTADSAGRLSVIDAQIICSLVSNTIGGTITGLTSEGLELTNGTSGGTFKVSKVNDVYPGTFTFTLPVTYNQTYGVTVLTQPATQTCSVANGTGIMGDNKVDTIAVTCVNKAT